MRLAGASDSGWVAIDLADVAAAIAALRLSKAAHALRQQPLPAPRP